MDKLINILSKNKLITNDSIKKLNNYSMLSNKNIFKKNFDNDFYNYYYRLFQNNVSKKIIFDKKSCDKFLKDIIINFNKELNHDKNIQDFENSLKKLNFCACFQIKINNFIVNINIICESFNNNKKIISTILNVINTFYLSFIESARDLNIFISLDDNNRNVIRHNGIY